MSTQDDTNKQTVDSKTEDDNAYSVVNVEDENNNENNNTVTIDIENNNTSNITNNDDNNDNTSNETPSEDSKAGESKSLVTKIGGTGLNIGKKIGGTGLNIGKKLGKTAFSEIADPLSDIKKIKLLPKKHDKKKTKEEIKEILNELSEKVSTREIAQNGLTSLFLVQDKGIWNEFPLKMKLLWLFVVIAPATMQWVSTSLLFDNLYSKNALDSSNKSPTGYIGTIFACTMLFIYLLGEVKVSFDTLQNAVSRVEPNAWGYFILVGLLADLVLLLFVSVICVIAISGQKHMADKLEAALAFFFILEIDEWTYNVFLKDFNVLEDEDFEIENVQDEEEEQDKKDDKIDDIRQLTERESNALKLQKKWSKQAKRSILWILILAGLIIWLILYATSTSAS